MKAEELSPGIQGAVISLWNAGWKTTDSGDGSNLADGMDCGWDEPMVVVLVEDKAFLSLFADGVLAHFKLLGISPKVEGTYSPNDGVSTVVVYGECLRNLKCP